LQLNSDSSFDSVAVSSASTVRVYGVVFGFLKIAMMSAGVKVRPRRRP